MAFSRDFIEVANYLAKRTKMLARKEHQADQNEGQQKDVQDVRMKQEILPTSLPSKRTPDWETHDQVLQPQARVQDPEKGAESTDTSFYFSSGSTGILVAACAILVVLLIAGLAVYQKRKKLKRNYEEVPEDGTSIKQRRKSSRCTDAAFYGCVTQNNPIDFVVPTLPAAYPSLPSPGETASLSSGSSTEGPLWAKLSLMDGNLLGPPGFSVLGGLNPELYRGNPETSTDDENYPDGHIGRLWFACEYDASIERLVVTLIKVKNLPSRVCGSVNSCDPFVRIFLFPDERRYVQSKLKKKTCNPKFEESFVFQIPVRMIEERSLKFSVYDNDRGKRYNIIGHVVYPLRELDLTTNEKVMVWRDLERDVNEAPAELGEILLCLCYNQSLERMTITVYEARGLQPPNGCNTVDSYVKLVFMMGNKPIKTKKTMVAKKTVEPNFKESFHFRLPTNQINLANVIIQLTVANGPHKDKSLGRVVLGSYMFARGKALQHWNQALSSSARQVREWHKLT